MENKENDEKRTVFTIKKDINKVPFDAEFYEKYDRVSFESKTLFDFFAELKNRIEDLQKFIYEFKLSNHILSSKEKDELDRSIRYLILN